LKRIHAEPKYARQLNVQANKNQSTHFNNFRNSRENIITTNIYEKYGIYILQCCDNFLKLEVS
jgi:hypothetical protein